METDASKFVTISISGTVNITGVEKTYMTVNSEYYLKYSSYEFKNNDEISIDEWKKIQEDIFVNGAIKRFQSKKKNLIVENIKDILNELQVNTRH